MVAQQVPLAPSTSASTASTTATGTQLHEQQTTASTGSPPADSSTTKPASSATNVAVQQPLTVAEASSSPFARLVSNQTIVVLDSFELESGVVLKQVPVAYKTWGNLNDTASNALVLCHALSGSADARDWWGPLFGRGLTFDPSKFFLFCANILGSPYGTASPCTVDPATGKPYGPTFPLTTVRDDVRLQRVILDRLGVAEIALVVGGSMGGMLVLEYALLFGPEYVRSIAAIATTGRHSAWCISWGEQQRQCIYADAKYLDGYYSYEDPPNTGLAAARMAALLTYRTRNSFQARFGRKLMPNVPVWTSACEAEVRHNEGHKFRLHKSVGRNNQTTSAELAASAATAARTTSTSNHSPSDSGISTPKDARGYDFSVYSAQSYLRYQGDKFVSRFDPNCYIAITRKLDTHDISKGRGSFGEALAKITQPSLVIGIQSDGLFTPDDQLELAEGMPNSRVVILDSDEGHDGFLLEFERMNALLSQFLKENSPQFYQTRDDQGDDEESAVVEQPTASTLAGETDDF